MSTKPPKPPAVSDPAEDSTSSSDNDNVVRQKLKATTINSTSAGGKKTAEDEADQVERDTVMSDNEGDPASAEQRRTRKRSHDDSDPEDAEARKEHDRRKRAHERTRSREANDIVGVGREKTPDVEMKKEVVVADKKDVEMKEKEGLLPPSVLERKRTADNVNEGEEGKAKKMSKMDKIEQEKTASSDAETNGEKEDKETVTKIPPGSGFANTGAKSPFANASTPIFGSKAGTSAQSLFANSKFGALSGSSASPFATTAPSPSPFGSSTTTASPFASFGNKPASPFGGSGIGVPSVFGSGMGLGSFRTSSTSPVKSTKPARAFGAPESDNEEDDDEDGTDDEDGKEKSDEDDVKTDERFHEQPVVTGEEDEETVLKIPSAKVYSFDNATKAWRERGRGSLKINKKTVALGPAPEVDEDETDDEEEDKDSPASEATESSEDLEAAVAEKKPIKEPAVKKSARLIVRTEGTLTLILNAAIYKELKVGGDPKGNVPTGNNLFFPAMEGGVSTTYIIKCSKAKELWTKIQELKAELWPAEEGTESS